MSGYHGDVGTETGARVQCGRGSVWAETLPSNQIAPPVSKTQLLPVQTPTDPWPLPCPPVPSTSFYSGSQTCFRGGGERRWGAWRRHTGGLPSSNCSGFLGLGETHRETRSWEGQRGAGAKVGQWEGTQEKEDEIRVRGPSQRDGPSVNVSSKGCWEYPVQPITGGGPEREPSCISSPSPSGAKLAKKQGAESQAPQVSTLGAQVGPGQAHRRSSERPLGDAWGPCFLATSLPQPWQAPCSGRCPLLTRL